MVLDIRVHPATGGDGAFIGARGISLSGGQKARVALARAAYNPKAVPWNTAWSTAMAWFAMVCHVLSLLQSLEEWGVKYCKADDILMGCGGYQVEIRP